MSDTTAQGSLCRVAACVSQAVRQAGTPAATHKPATLCCMAKHAWLLILALLIAGCPSRPALVPLEPLPLDRAIEVVNENTARLTTGLKATGPVRGEVRISDGSKHSFDLSGKLLLIPPYHLRFDVQNALGRTEFLLGSNADHFWLHVERDEDTFRFGRHATPEDERAVELPIRPDWMIEALGLNTLPTDTTGPAGPIQTVEHDHQRLLFITHDDDGQGMIRKEYWLSRYRPRLIERVVYRDDTGVELMHSQLIDYRRQDETGLLLPRRMRLEWPTQDSWIEFRVRRWQERGDLSCELPAFQLDAPEVLRQRYRQVIDIDSGHTFGPAP